MKSAVLAVSVAFALLAAGAAHAELIVEGAPRASSLVQPSYGSSSGSALRWRPAVVQSAPARVTPAVQSGSPQYDGVLSGWANAVPLELALRQVVPAAMTVRANGIDLGKSVSWRGGRPWVDVLEELGRQQNFTTNVDWSRAVVTLSQALPPAPVVAVAPMSGPTIVSGPAIISGPAIVSAPAAPLTQPVIYRAPAQAPQVQQVQVQTQEPVTAPVIHRRPAPAATIVVEQPSPAHVTVATRAPDPAKVIVAPARNVAYAAPASQPSISGAQVWRLVPSLTLRENVELWVKQAGWSRVVWDAADYPVAAEATFYGDFSSPDGPLARLIRAYEGSDQPLIARLSTLDKVVNVVNKNYTPAEVDIRTPQQAAPTAFEAD